MKIGKEFQFEAAHYLPNKEIYGKCRNLHGHTYTLIIEIEGNIQEEGWILNFSEFGEIVKKSILTKLDHSCLNDYIEIPTAENIILYIYESLKNGFNNKNIRISKIKLYETKNSYAFLEFGEEYE